MRWNPTKRKSGLALLLLAAKNLSTVHCQSLPTSLDTMKSPTTVMTVKPRAVRSTSSQKRNLVFFYLMLSLVLLDIFGAFSYDKRSNGLVLLLDLQDISNLRAETVKTDDDAKEDAEKEKTTSATVNKTLLTPLRDHPHAGALDESGQFYGYVVDAKALTRTNRTSQKEKEFTMEQICDSPETKHWLKRQSFDLLDYFVNKLKVTPSNSQQSSTSPTPRVLCMVYTYDESHRGPLRSIVETWAPRCDGFFAASTLTDPQLNAVNLPHRYEESYDTMWQKTRSILAYASDNFLDDFDCFHLSGDDSMIIPDNLRALCQSMTTNNPSAPFYGGSWNPLEIIDGDDDGIFAGGGPGYTMNRVALKALVNDAFPTCYADTRSSKEDVFTSKCLRSINILVNQTLDNQGKQRYLDGGFADIRPRYNRSIPLNKEKLTWRQKVHKWRTVKLGYNMGVGKDVGSVSAVAFHGMDGSTRLKDDDLRHLDAIIYNQCPKGTLLERVKSNFAQTVGEYFPSEQSTTVQVDDCSKVRVPKTKFAIFSYNFGNYRGETRNNEAGLAQLAAHGFDCHFFVNDDENAPDPASFPQGWTVTKLAPQNETNGIPSDRVQSKVVKFQFHQVLEKYEYLIHVDSKNSRLEELDDFLRGGLLQLVLKHESKNKHKSLYIEHHEVRDSISQEIDRLKELPSLQPLPQLQKWENKLKSHPHWDSIEAAPLCVTKIWVIRNDPSSRFLAAWNSIYDVIIENGLWRDQVAINYAIYNHTKEIELIDTKNFPGKCPPITIE